MLRHRFATFFKSLHYYYTIHADASGASVFEYVRSGIYGLYAWSIDSSRADVNINLTVSGVISTRSEATSVGK